MAHLRTSKVSHAGEGVAAGVERSIDGRRERGGAQSCRHDLEDSSAIRGLGAVRDARSMGVLKLAHEAASYGLNGGPPLIST
jgi:hypothetical protein